MKKTRTGKTLETTIGLDLGDKHHYYCMLDPEGVVIKRGKIGANSTRRSQIFFRAVPVVDCHGGRHALAVDQPRSPGA